MRILPFGWFRRIGTWITIWIAAFRNRHLEALERTAKQKARGGTCSKKKFKQGEDIGSFYCVLGHEGSEWRLICLMYNLSKLLRNGFAFVA